MRSASAALLTLVLTALAPAQNISGTVTGLVTDTAGSVIPGVAINLTNVATGLKLSPATP